MLNPSTFCPLFWTLPFPSSNDLGSHMCPLLLNEKFFIISWIFRGKLPLPFSLENICANLYLFSSIETYPGRGARDLNVRRKFSDLFHCSNEKERYVWL